ncbi:hypothetical protein PHMEG_00026006 [Phytophthora megakarya]|uniref:Uncharacterized protein n=1 Tax=Phytophthora megakarya TaxID=4795 RepID=A0A225VAM1_9STRA|nr:hypothetical protein PHMEG_00026006 [Phytophthora megakarya]
MEQKSLEGIEKEAKALRKAKRKPGKRRRLQLQHNRWWNLPLKETMRHQEAIDPETGGRKPKPVNAGTTSEGGVNVIESPASEEKEIVPEPTSSAEVVEIVGEDSNYEEKSPMKTEPSSTLDYTAWLEAAKTTSDFLPQQATLGSQDTMWIADLNATRLGFETAQDLLGVQDPTALCEARQCAALLQTLLFEAGFQFDNVIPE